MELVVGNQHNRHPTPADKEGNPEAVQLLGPAHEFPGTILFPVSDHPGHD